MHVTLPTLLACALAAVLLPAAANIFREATPPSFRDPSLKFGGAAVADLDANGYPDLILPYHGAAPVDIYFNFAGRFVKSTFSAGGDMHATVPFRAGPADRGMCFTVSRGGSKGNAPRSAVMFAVDPNTLRIANVTDQSGITARVGRGRTALYVDLSTLGARSVPDVIYLNAKIEKCPSCVGPQHHVFKNMGAGRFEPRRVRALATSSLTSGTVVDIDGDGVMEVILFDPGLEIYKQVGPFRLRNITAEVLPDALLRYPLLHIAAVAELDFDNDGDFDLYLARGKSGNRMKLNRGKLHDDVLLENRGGVFVDVSRAAGIPRDTFSFGVTAGDFDNDGFTDVYVTRYDTPDAMLWNNGNGTFRAEEGLVPRPKGTVGDMAQAVDYDLDGRLDLVVGQGERANRAVLGRYRLFRNRLRGAARRGFVLVRVGSSPRGRAVSLHATVRVRSARRTWVRRVGSPGTAVSGSYIETVHVGIDRAVVDVTVLWVNGEEETRVGVARGSRIEMGLV